MIQYIKDIINEFNQNRNEWIYGAITAFLLILVLLPGYIGVFIASLFVVAFQILLFIGLAGFFQSIYTWIKQRR